MTLRYKLLLKQMIEIVAELSANHGGSLDVALKTIEAAYKAGADTIKAQAYTPDKISVRGFKITEGPWEGYDYHDLYIEGATPYEWFPKLKEVTNDLGMEFFASAFDNEAVDMLERLEVKRHKIASFEITDIGLIKYMVSKKKPLIISTGIATDEDIHLAEKNSRSVPVTWLVCTSSYPTLPENVGIKRMKEFTNVGLSDHSKGIIAPVLSVAYNPKLIEKHFILDHSIKTIDSTFSLDPKEFKETVDAVRVAEQMNKLVFPEVDKRFARSLWVVKDIIRGDKFTSDNVKSLRPNYGIHPKYLDSVINKTSVADIKAFSPLVFDLFR